MAASSSSNPMPMTNFTPMITLKLNSSNYLYWRIQMLPLLSLQQLLPHVDGTSTIPPKTISSNDKVVDNPEFSEWVQNEQKTLILLNASLTEEALSVIVGLTSAREIWLALEAAFCSASVERVQNLCDTFRLTQKGDKSVSEFGHTFKSICDQLSAIGHAVEPMDQIHWFLCGLGPTFETFSTTVRSIRPLPAFSDLLARAESHELFVKSLHGPQSHAAAFSASSQQQGANRSSLAHGSQPTRGPGFGPAKSRPNNYRNNKSRQPRSSGPFNSRHNQNQNNTRRPPICQLCRTPGCYATQCPKLATFATSATLSEDHLASAFHAQCNVNEPDWTCDTGSANQASPSPGLP
ncbi:putative RNA-directed DNA polymerase [Helianthus annuus]|nr:putative RNA-directed DNA polymerase [Helianthus annuus]